MYTTLSIQSTRLTTRSLLAQDAEQLYTMYSDADAMQFRGSAPMKSITDAQDMIAHQMIDDNGVQKIRLAIIAKATQQLIGTLLLKFNDRSPNKCEIGYSFDKKAWNKGYGSETINMTLEGLKQQLNITQVHAWCKKGNTASIHILKKNGFVLQAQLEFPNSFLYIRTL